MHGNVSEWCFGLYVKYAVGGDYVAGGVRGGSWGSNVDDFWKVLPCRSDSRDDGDASYGGFDNGFRLSCSAGQ